MPYLWWRLGRAFAVCGVKGRFYVARVGNGHGGIMWLNRANVGLSRRHDNALKFQKFEMHASQSMGRVAFIEYMLRLRV